MKRPLGVAILGLTLACAAAAGLALRLTSDPAGAWLWRSDDADWIREDAPLVARHHRIGETRMVFRCRFELAELPPEAGLTLAALRGYRLTVNGVDRTPPPGRPWNEPSRIPLAGALHPGTNEIRVEVWNDRGPPALLASSRALGLATGRPGPTWASSRDGQHWAPARSAFEREPLEVASAFPSPAESLAAVLPVLALLFALGAAGSFWSGLRPSHVRWLLLGAFGLLCAHDLWSLDLGVGFDVIHHHAYVVYIAKTGRVPLASDGWQMFQSPLYYLVATPFHVLLSHWLAAPGVFRALRVLSMLCGLAQIEIAFRVARLVFREARFAQIAATVVGGLLPINLYSAQVFSNEPMAGALTALLVWAAMLLLCGRGPRSPLRAGAVLGGLLGLAALAKVTPILLVPLLIGVLVFAGCARRATGDRIGASVAAFAAVAAGVAGWYYLRNWLLLGRPFVGGWDPARGFGWWQDPGVRGIGDYAHFGESLVRPLYASMAGFWDGLYSTLWLDGFLSGVAHARSVPWQMDYVSSMALLSLPMTAALLAGAALAFRRAPQRPARVFAAACLALYLAAMLVVFTAVPAYSSVKATYTLGLLPCYGVLAGSALAAVVRGRVSRALVSGYLAAWAGAAWLGYWA